MHLSLVPAKKALQTIDVSAICTILQVWKDGSTSEIMCNSQPVARDNNTALKQQILMTRRLLTPRPSPNGSVAQTGLKTAPAQ